MADRSAAAPAPLVLVVDDEEQMTAIIAFALETEGLRSVVASDARSARELLAREPIELVVLDVMLPDESGIELCRSLRETSDVPVILLTALGEVDDRVAGLTAGADDYLTKPFSPRELALRVQAILRRTAGTGAAAVSGQVLRCGPLPVDPGAGTASWDGTALQLRRRSCACSPALLRTPVAPCRCGRCCRTCGARAAPRAGGTWSSRWSTGSASRCSPRVHRRTSSRPCAGRDIGHACCPHPVVADVVTERHRAPPCGDLPLGRLAPAVLRTA